MMDKAIKNRIPVHVDLLPNRDAVYSGICLKDTHEVFIFICFNDDLKEFDGIAIIKSKEIENFRYWDNDELAEIKRDNSSDYFDTLPLDKMNTFYECLWELRDKQLLAVFTDDDESSYYVGKMIGMTSDSIALKLVSENGKWIGNKPIKISEINYIGFDSKYELDLINVLQQGI